MGADDDQSGFLLLGHLEALAEWDTDLDPGLDSDVIPPEPLGGPADFLFGAPL
jgi:hypothetical protein